MQRTIQATTILTKAGLIRLIQKTRKLVDCDLAKLLDINDRRFTPAETDFVSNVQKAFCIHRSIPQHSVGIYFIDLYFPDLNIAVEFDERHHSKTIAADAARQKWITEELSCRFLRVKESDNIFGAIGRLHALIIG